MRQDGICSLRNGSNSILHIRIAWNDTFEEVVEELGLVMERISFLIDVMLNITLEIDIFKKNIIILRLRDIYIDASVFLGDDQFSIL